MGLVLVALGGITGIIYGGYVLFNEMYHMNKENDLVQQKTQHLMNNSDKVTPEMETALRLANHANEATELANSVKGLEQKEAMLVANDAIQLANRGLENANKSLNSK